MSNPPHPARGQTALEYLLLFALVSFVVFLAMIPNTGLMTQAHTISTGYFESITNVIMGENPKPIDGNWCLWGPLDPDSNTQWRTCECPAPAFGGKFCEGEAISVPPPNGGWGPWSACDPPCGPGHRTRTCQTPPCLGPPREACSSPACPDCPNLDCSSTENCLTCPQDCGVCPPGCGDATCQPTETCSSCPLDCGICTPPPLGNPVSVNYDPWDPLLRSIGMWVAPPGNTRIFPNLLTHYYSTLNAPVPGTYTIDFSSDNVGNVYIDGTNVCSWNDWATQTTCTVDLTPGSHSIEITVVNNAEHPLWGRNPGGAAIRIKDPSGNTLLSSGELDQWGASVDCPNGTSWFSDTYECK